MIDLRFRIRDLFLLMTSVAIYFGVVINFAKRFPHSAFLIFAFFVMPVFFVACLFHAIQVKRHTEHKLRRIAREREKSLGEG